MLAAISTAPAVLLAEPAHWAHDVWLIALDLLGQHLRIFIGFVLALLIGARLMLEKRTPSNVFAWGLLIFFIPWLGVPLYFLFGGYKIRGLMRTKLQVNAFAVQLAAGLAVVSPPPASTRALVSSRRKFAHNSFAMQPDGVTAFQALRAEIARAEKTIHLQTFIFGHDEPARQIMDDLTARARAGVEVKLLLDSLGSFGAWGRLAGPLRRAGGRVVRFLPVLPLQTKGSANLRNHRKFAIFDRERVLVGGQNIDRRFMDAHENPGLFVDFGALIAGPVAAEFNRNFVSDWCFASGDSPRDFSDLLAYAPPARGDEQVEVVASGPERRGRRALGTPADPDPAMQARADDCNALFHPRRGAVPLAAHPGAPGPARAADSAGKLEPPPR